VVGGGGSTESLSSPELGMAGACCPRVQGEPYPFYRRRQREESELGSASWGRATGMACAQGQGAATAVDVVASRGACGGARQLDAEPGRSGLGEVRS